jgi:drug/metabolite transporter (DMT)-like permease
MRAAASAYALLSLCVLFWSGNVLTARALHADIAPFTLSFWRWALAFLVLLPWVVRDLAASLPLIRLHWRSLVPAGILGMGAYSSLVYLGLQSTSASNAALINAALPVVIAALGSAWFRSRLSAVQWGGVGVSLAGVTVIVLQGNLLQLGTARVNPGDLWVFAAVVGFAVYTLRFRRADVGLSPRLYLAATIAIAAAMSAPLHLLEIASRPVTLSAALVAGLIYLAIFPSILSYTFWNKGVEILGPARAGAMLNLMPIFTAGLAVLLLNEELNRFHAAGACLILGGIGMTAWGRQTRRAANRSSTSAHACSSRDASS